MGKNADELSLLGYGCMRFPRKLGAIDMEKTEQQIVRAIAGGVNYFDTAYMYPGNEKALGTVLAVIEEGVSRRSKVKIATKLPMIMTNSRADMEKFFKTSLERLQTDYIDYFLLHSINSLPDWNKMKEMGVEDFIREKLENGSIKNIGFSYHGNLHDFKNIIDDYPWDFCQIQFNYLDEYFQAGREGLDYAAQKGIGVIIMEPLRGGMLIDKMPPEAKKAIDSYNKENDIGYTPAEWGLRWVFNHPGVTSVLSGMNVDEHIDENIRIASEATPNSLSEDDLAMIDRVKEIFQSAIKVPCTGCSYCMPCPAGVNIPQCFAMYNNKFLFPSVQNSVRYYMQLEGVIAKPSLASMCKKCGQCEKHCPQEIPIMEKLDDVAKTMESAFLRTIVRLAVKIMRK